MYIYAVKLEDIDCLEINNISFLLPIYKRQKINRLINKKDKIRTLIGEILIRTIILKELKIKHDNIQFDKNKYGKPYLSGYKDFNFNISHSGDFVVCVIDEKPIGVDIEQEKLIEHKEIAGNFFTEGEYKYISKGDLDTQIRKFYDIWTLKESYIKCCGTGLSMKLNSFSISIDTDKNISVDSSDEYAFKIFNQLSGYKMSVCSLNKEISQNIKIINQDDLINKFYKLALQEKETC